MKILWIVNTIFPKLSEAINQPPPVSGGWMYGLAEKIAEETGVELSVATTYRGGSLKKYSINSIDYYLLPCNDNTKYDRKLELYWKDLCREYKPDLIHIHGTEFAHGLACMRAFPKLNFVISIQGLVSVCKRYYYSGISRKEIFFNLTFKDLIARTSIFHGRAKFKQRAKIEKLYLFECKHVIGRTTWDYSHVKALNKEVTYHFCNESLRKGFYNARKWSYTHCQPFSIFLSQAGYPIKGVHQVIKAIALIKDQYPQILLKVGGPNILKRDSLNARIRFSGYGKYIQRLINRYGLENNIEFLGPLKEEEIISQYLKANLFICPSSIENSPNSLGEAQILGVPTIASYVGGIPDMIEDGKTGILYRFEEVEVLAKKISDVFEDGYTHQMYSSSIECAELRHDEGRNFRTLKNIYYEIIEGE